MPAFNEHPLRRALADEVHARPYGLIQAPVRLTHLAVLSGEGGAAAERKHLGDLCANFGVTPPGEADTHFSANLGNLWVKWERHTEFSAFTFYLPGEFDQPFEQPASAQLPEGWLTDLTGEVIAAINVAIESEAAQPRSFDELAHLFADNTVTGSGMRDGQALVWTDFRIHEDGFSRILVRDKGMNQRQTGRLVQRLLEISTYRMMAMLAHPLARDCLPELSNLESNLSTLIGEMADTTHAEDDREILGRLSALSADVESLSARTAYRFNAAGAYHGLVHRRIEELREVRLEEGEVRGLQPPGEFIHRRLQPAMDTVSSVAARMETLSRRIARASDLLRTRVDVALEEQNSHLLQSMDRRARLQLRLQETVEGLSVVAISYYLTGLVFYVMKSAKAAGLPANPDLAAGLALPLVVALVWLGVRRLRRALIKHEGES